MSKVARNARQMQPPQPLEIHLVGMNKFRCPISSSMSQESNLSLSGSEPNESLGELDVSLIEIKNDALRRSTSGSMAEKRKISLDDQGDNEAQAEAQLMRSEEIVLRMQNRPHDVLDYNINTMPD